MTKTPPSTSASTTAGARASERRQLFLLALLTLLPFAALAIWAHYLSPAPWELGLLDAVAAGPGLLGQTTGAINALGNLPVWAVIVTVAAVLVAYLRDVRSAVFVALSFASDLAAFAVKVVVERARPDTVAAEHFFGPDSFGFPSGHTVRAAALVAAVLWVLLPSRVRLRGAVLGGLVAGAVMGYSRVALQVHWPTDVIGGTLLGLGWFALTALLFDHFRQRHSAQS